MKLVLGLIVYSIFVVGSYVTAYSDSNNKPLAENFTETSLDGQPATLENMRGKVVVLTFWSTRCAICSNEIPKLNKIAAKYSGQNVVFWGMTMENDSLVQGYLSRKPFNFRIFPNSLGTILKYADKDSKGNPNIGYPTYYIINQQGEVDYKASGYGKTGNIDSTVGRLLSN